MISKRLQENLSKRKNKIIKVQEKEDYGSYLIQFIPVQYFSLMNFELLPEDNRWIFIRSCQQNRRLDDLTKFINSGDILISINDELVLKLSVEELKERIDDMKKKRKSDFKLRLLTPSVTSLQSYLQMDRPHYYDIYGFQCSEDDILRERRNETYDLTHDKEWHHYIESKGGVKGIKVIGKYESNEFKLQELVRKGIPHLLRATIWPRISLSTSYRLQFQRNYYQFLCIRAQNELNEDTKEEIMRDIDRTFPNHRLFVENSPTLKQLERVLSAYAIHNPKVGYAQSLNFLVGTMLIVLMNEEESFWLLATVIEKILPPDYYGTLTGVYIDQLVIGYIIEHFFPKLHQKISEKRLPFPTLQWFLCLFIHALQFETILRIWDIFLNEGHETLFRIAFTLLELYEEEFIKNENDWSIVFHKIRQEITAEKLIHLTYFHPRYHHVVATSTAATTTTATSHNTITPLPSAGRNSSTSASTSSIWAFNSSSSSSAANNNTKCSTTASTTTTTATTAKRGSFPFISSLIHRQPLHQPNPIQQQQQLEEKTNSKLQTPPSTLKGIGAAHLGPIQIERGTSERYLPIKDLSSHSWTSDKSSEKLISHEIVIEAHQKSAEFFHKKIFRQNKYDEDAANNGIEGEEMNPFITKRKKRSKSIELLSATIQKLMHPTYTTFTNEELFTWRKVFSDIFHEHRAKQLLLNGEIRRHYIQKQQMKNQQENAKTLIDY